MEAREIERCIDAFGADVFRFCRRLCADRADADDLYQQVFLRALEARVALDWASNPRALFFSLAYRLWKSDARKRARRQAIAPSECLDDAPADALCAPGDLQERVENAQRDAAIRAIVPLPAFRSAPRAIGEYASTAMPCSLQNATTSRCCHVGCSSI